LETMEQNENPSSTEMNRLMDDTRKEWERVTVIVNRELETTMHEEPFDLASATGSKEEL
jgi:translation elongation factor EF-1alpha